MKPTDPRQKRSTPDPRQSTKSYEATPKHPDRPITSLTRPSGPIIPLSTQIKHFPTDHQIDPHNLILRRVTSINSSQIYKYTFQDVTDMKFYTGYKWENDACFETLLTDEQAIKFEEYLFENGFDDEKNIHCFREKYKHF